MTTASNLTATTSSRGREDGGLSPLSASQTSSAGGAPRPGEFIKIIYGIISPLSWPQGLSGLIRCRPYIVKQPTGILDSGPVFIAKDIGCVNLCLEMAFQNVLVFGSHSRRYHSKSVVC